MSKKANKSTRVMRGDEYLREKGYGGPVMTGEEYLEKKKKEQEAESRKSLLSYAENRRAWEKRSQNPENYTDYAVGWWNKKNSGAFTGSAFVVFSLKNRRFCSKKGQCAAVLY